MSEGRAHTQFAHVRLGVQYHPNHRTGRHCLHYRLEAKAPGEEWSTRSTVVHGTEHLDGASWPPSRDDMLAMMVEVLMGIRWQ